MKCKSRRVVALILNLAFTVVILSGLMVLPRPVSAQGDEAGWLLSQINALRQQHGIAPLTVNAHLIVSATQHSTYLANNPYTDPHVESNGSRPRDRIAAAGYTGRIVGENVVGGSSATVQWAFQWWVNEPIHYKNMLASWTEVGVGIASGPYGHWYTTDFGIGSGDAPALPAPTAAPPAGGNNAAPSGDTPQPPPPTRRPATRVPTLTPSLTFTPSITFTARPTFTPTFTPTLRPPTGTAIVLEVSPQVSAPPPTSVQVANAIPTATTEFVRVSVADLPSQQTATADSDPGEGIRRLIPWVIGLQAVILVGFVFRSILRRGSH